MIIQLYKYFLKKIDVFFDLYYFISDIEQRGFLLSLV